MEKRLIGKVALVTGSSGVIGPAIVRRLAAEGAVVAATDRSLKTARAVADEAAASGGEVRAFALDVTDAAQVDSAFAAVEAGLGPVDILVNNAGFVRKSSDPFQLVEEELWSRILDVNLGGVIRCCRRQNTICRGARTDARAIRSACARAAWSSRRRASRIRS